LIIFGPFKCETHLHSISESEDVRLVVSDSIVILTLNIYRIHKFNYRFHIQSTTYKQQYLLLNLPAGITGLLIETKKVEL
jgi:hypothetical protein